jgi:hypothetical protein
MDKRLEGWKKEYNKQKLPAQIQHEDKFHTVLVTFNVDNFPDNFPDYVKTAFSNIRVPLSTHEPEFKGGTLNYSEKSKEGAVKIFCSKESQWTYRVDKDIILLALNRFDPKAANWYKNYLPLLNYVVFSNQQIESIVD